MREWWREGPDTLHRGARGRVVPTGVELAGRERPKVVKGRDESKEARRGS